MVNLVECDLFSEMRARSYDLRTKKSQLGLPGTLIVWSDFGVSSFDEKHRSTSWSMEAVSLASFTLCSALGGILT